MGFITDTPPGFGVEVRRESFVIIEPATAEKSPARSVEFELHLLSPLVSALVEAAARGGDKAIPKPDEERERRREVFERFQRELKIGREAINILTQISSQLEERL